MINFGKELGSYYLFGSLLIYKPTRYRQLDASSLYTTLHTHSHVYGGVLFEYQMEGLELEPTYRCGVVIFWSVETP